MIGNVKLNKFKRFEELRLDCASLNLLCGLNGAGKQRSPGPCSCFVSRLLLGRVEV